MAVKTERGVAYGPERRHRLDIHLPSDRKLAGAPTLFFIHGGRWRMGFKEWNTFQAPVLADMGVILVSPQYGLSPDFRFPTQLEDILTALAWVHANIPAYGGAPDRLYLAGHSAGGHLSALATVRSDLHKTFGLPTEAIRACLPISGTMNLDFDQVPPGSEEEEIRQILLADAADAPRASPLRYAQGVTTPFFISYGEQDFGRVIATSREMHRALEAAGNQATAHEFSRSRPFRHPH